MRIYWIFVEFICKGIILTSLLGFKLLFFGSEIAFHKQFNRFLWFLKAQTPVGATGSCQGGP